jgi:hypothetical protein
MINLSFKEWETWLTNLPDYPNNNESNLAMQTLKICVSEKTLKIDAAEINGYALFDYTMFCYFIFRARLCVDFPQSFVEKYDAHTKALMTLYSNHYFDIPQEKIHRLIVARENEYNRIGESGGKDVAYEAIDKLIQHIEKDYDGDPEYEGASITNIFAHYDLFDRVLNCSNETMDALEKQANLFLYAEKLKRNSQPKQETVKIKLESVKEAVKRPAPPNNPPVERSATKNQSKKDLIKIAVIAAIAAIALTLIICWSVGYSRTEKFNAELRNFATEPMNEDYTNVYADVISMEPEYFVYRYKTKNGIKIGNEELWEVVCRCETVEGKIIWATFFYHYYPEGGYSKYEADYKAVTYSRDNPLRLQGKVDTAKEVTDELEDAIGNVFVLDARERPKQKGQ